MIKTNRRSKAVNMNVYQICINIIDRCCNGNNDYENENDTWNYFQNLKLQLLVNFGKNRTAVDMNTAGGERSVGIIAVRAQLRIHPLTCHCATLLPCLTG